MLIIDYISVLFCNRSCWISNLDKIFLSSSFPITKAFDLWTEKNIEGYIELGQIDVKRGDYFLRVIGDSMEGCHIFDGDLVYVQQCNVDHSGQITVVMVGEEATIKKFIIKKILWF